MNKPVGKISRIKLQKQNLFSLQLPKNLYAVFYVVMFLNGTMASKNTSVRPVEVV